jgi:exodeoxyribonuclease III
MLLVSWNVNGIRAALKKGFLDVVDKLDPDIMCIQETKAQQEQVALELKGYYQYWNSAEKKGYSGTLVLTKEKPLKISYGINHKDHDNEGRVITVEYKKFCLVNVYTPNSQPNLKRLKYRMKWEDAFKKYLRSLKKPVIVCGDLNVAHEEIDLKNPKTNQDNAGFTPDERNKLSVLLDSGYIDTFRYLYPDKVAYSWWSYRYRARNRNIGWRVDYFLISNKLKKKLKNAYIYDKITGSDHCPIGIEIAL